MIPNLVDGRLPLGRWPATPDEVRHHFVQPGDTHREEIWDHWVQLTDALRSMLGELPVAWLSGSFLTDKAQPADIDCVYVVEVSAVRALRGDARAAGFLELVARSQVKAVLNLKVDSYVLQWLPTPGVGRVLGESYRADRGYWDDLWSRERSAILRDDSIPRRGYLEVMIDGYK